MKRSRQLPVLLTVLAVVMVSAPSGGISAQRRSDLRIGLDVPTMTQPHSVPTVRLGAATATHWKEGLIIGTIIGALVIYQAGVVGIDKFTPRVVLGLAIGGWLIGGVPGALIGGQFPKNRPQPPQ